jgi:hypothetical protein
MSVELSWSAEEMREMDLKKFTAAHKNMKDRFLVDEGKPYEPPVEVASIPSLDLTRELYAAVVRSEDDDCSASEALDKLQKRVLMACARFEAASVIV